MSNDSYDELRNCGLSARVSEGRPAQFLAALATRVSILTHPVPEGEGL